LFVSVTVDTTVCGELGCTVAVVDPLIDSAMLLGGHVEKYPAADVTSDTFAFTIVDPGRFAVAVPLGLAPPALPVTGFGFVGFVVLLIVTTFAVTGVNVIVPTPAFTHELAHVVASFAHGLHSVTPPGPVAVVSASSGNACPFFDSVWPCDTHAAWLGIVIDVIGGWM
jgi:hypothetical protein